MPAARSASRRAATRPRLPRWRWRHVACIAAYGTSVSVGGVPNLKSQLRSDLNTSMKARDEVSTATLRMALTAITNEEVAGKTARELSDDEVLKVLVREAKKRREAAEAFDGAGRVE